MEILLTGNTALVTQEWIRAAFPQDHVLRTTWPAERAAPDSGQCPEPLPDGGSFDRIVYFSADLTLCGEQPGDAERLYRLLQAGRERPVQLLYLAGPESVLTPPAGKSVLAQSAERLCRYYARSSCVRAKILRLPYLYALDVPRAGGGLEDLFRQARRGSLQFEGPASQPVPALCMEDLAVLVARIFESWTPEPEVLTVPQPFPLLCRDLGEGMAQLRPGLKVCYGTAAVRQYLPQDDTLRKRYGWFPRYSLREDLPALWESWQKACPPQAGRRRFRQGPERGRMLPELLAAWLAAEGLVRLTGTQAQFRMVDFRLLFVVLSGTLYGLNAGVLAGILAAASLVWGYARQGVAPVLLFYEPSYWLGFLVYLVAGAVCGYVQRRSMDAVCFAQAQAGQLRQQLALVRQLYRDALAEKRSLTEQLLGRRDSFGKIYTVVRRLDTAQPQLLYRNAVQAMEDVLQNSSAALYRLTAQGQEARLVAASPAGAPRDRTLPRQVFRQLQPVLEQGGLWVNRALAPGLPMYAAAARYRGRPALLLVLWEAREEQLTLYEQNLFRILSGLVETALGRALAYEAATRQEQLLPGTQFLGTAAFTRRLAASCALQDAGMARHLLLRIHSGDWNAARLQEQLRGICREGDAVGQAADHSLCILLEQAGAADLPAITRRLAARGIPVREVAGEEQLRLAGAKQEGTV